MRVVIIGGGEVGFHVAKALSEENFDITVIDIDPEKCRRVSETIDGSAVEGNGASPKTLREANVSDADYVLCLTRVDEVNLIASQQAHELGARKIISRLRNQQYTERGSIVRPEKFGVDLVIHPEQAATEEIIRLIKHPYAVQAMDFEGGRLKMLGIFMDKSCSNFLNRSLRELAGENDHFKFGIIAVLREGETFVPWADFKFEIGDTVYFIVKSEDEDNLISMLCLERKESKRIMIMGGSKIGRSLAEALKDDYSVRLLELKRKKANKIANAIDNIMVIEGDGTDIEFLKTENIQEVDTFISVTENEKTNLIAGLLAHHLGARQSITHVTTTEYIPTIHEIGIVSVVSKNLSTVNSILKVMHSDISNASVTTFEEIDVDVIEFQPEKGSSVVKSPLQDLDFPADSIVGMINHHGKLVLARGDSQLTVDDIALVFAKPKAIPKLKKLFSA
ncbi:MAG: Trk system potassium transporter TrkA [Candidatus Marinimicrobia bacterium]|jgi:trk system potassium uptake protein TrkA|nr:Trk system potassium transporter TrkA [Candidatus Neomarinimicrobiota bacterium]MBT3495854.1 Trk system potassium transporter TrkA [Candidatus Neomarinimicrobiota bacterium]MBT3692854.1 Trk system potassium transporter TrkA [Candidatus Neomarinimicrobiota bacterium]MBT3731500.1 Trk system potassium transporter TrkA [Candidatus Neomarinimicrobiota bacterium]MBT4144307.1 Trk system potassium transporter TrkA [Candidatus Neomarinimicrobiota bacterium]